MTLKKWKFKDCLTIQNNCLKLSCLRELQKNTDNKIRKNQNVKH